LDVSRRITGGWMMGTSDMYEYAATVMGPTRLGARTEATKIDVGPSAAPMIPIEAASLMLNPNSVASIKVPKMPNCAAAPKSA